MAIMSQNKNIKQIEVPKVELPGLRSIRIQELFLFKLNTIQCH